MLRPSAAEDKAAASRAIAMQLGWFAGEGGEPRGIWGVRVGEASHYSESRSIDLPDKAQGACHPCLRSELEPLCVGLYLAGFAGAFGSSSRLSIS